MSFLENLKMAFESIRSNKLRSFLTMLGIIIGISSVIAIVSLGEGGKAAITGEFDKIGASTVNIRVRGQNAQKSDYITMEDIRQIKEKVETVRYATPMVQKSGVVTAERSSKRSVFYGVNNDFSYIQNIEMAYGRLFSDREVLEGRPVIIIDENTAENLFGYADAVGKTVKAGPRNSLRQATVIGITKSGESFMFGVDENMPAFVYTPVTFLQNLFPNDFVIDNISIMANSKEESEAAANGALNILQSRHNNRGREVYRAENALRQLDQINRVVGIFTAFIGAVAAISLIVGGIGVMNIMLVSVTERTREIGIRKAIGATTGTILLQFLTESVIISVMGGIIGLILGITGATLAGRLANVTPVLSFSSIMGAILFSSAVGIFFGIYPARKAAKLDPIDALRYE
jgi:putative ABC transport system permease protein